MQFIIYLMVLGGIALVISAFLSRGGGYKDSRIKLPREGQQSKKVRLRSLLGSIFPFSQAILQKFKLDTKIGDRLAAAHVNITTLEFFNTKLAFMIALGILGFFVVGKPEPLYALLGVAFGYIAPDFWLKKKINQRRFAIARILPETVDLLGLCVEAGLDFTTSVKWVIEKIPSNPMIEELAFVLEEIRWGKPRVQALKDMAKRLNIIEVSSFVQTLVQAERMGTPVTEAFAILSEDTRMQRFHKGERFALQAPIKILLPLIFCIMPVIGIIIGGPIFLQFMSGGLFKGFGK